MLTHGAICFCSFAAENVNDPTTAPSVGVCDVEMCRCLGQRGEVAIILLST